MTRHQRGARRGEDVAEALWGRRVPGNLEGFLNLKHQILVGFGDVGLNASSSEGMECELGDELENLMQAHRGSTPNNSQ